MIKRTNRIALSSMNEIAFVWVRGTEGVRLFCTRTLKQVIPNRFHFHAIERMQHRYYVTLLVRGESSAEIYIKNWPFRLREQISHKSLVPYLNVGHEEMLNSVNPNHESHAAWVISVGEHPVDDSSLIRYLEL